MTIQKESDTIIATPLYSKDKNIDVGSLKNILKFGNLDKGYFLLYPDGSVRLTGLSTGWDDLRIPIERTKKIATKEPDDIIYKGGLVSGFPNTADSGVTFNVQMPHSWLQGSPIIFHVHYILSTNAGSTTENIKFNFTYSWANINESYPTESIIPVTTNVQNDVADVHKILSFPELNHTDKTLSSQIICSLTRDTSVINGYPNSVYITEVDFHYQVDGFGSDEEYIKQEPIL